MNSTNADWISCVSVLSVCLEDYSEMNVWIFMQLCGLKGNDCWKSSLNFWKDPDHILDLGHHRYPLAERINWKTW